MFEYTEKLRSKNQIRVLFPLHLSFAEFQQIYLTATTNSFCFKKKKKNKSLGKKYKNVDKGQALFLTKEF